MTKWCRACHENGYQCELPLDGHEQHQGGDYTWTGTTEWRERQNDVLETYFCMGRIDTTPEEIAMDLDMPLAEVQTLLKTLRAEGLL